MGIAPGDADGNGEFDLFVTNYHNETNTFYRNQSSLLFADVTEELGLGAPSRARLGFGTSFADFDNDGWLDLIVANGHVQDRLQELNRDEPFAQLPMLLHNQRGRRFREVTAGAGDYFRNPHVARSTAIADYDRDGDDDIVVNNLNDAAALLKNESAKSNWIRIELIGVNSNRCAVGAILRLDLAERTIVRCLHAGSGYLSTDEATMLIGVGPAEEVRRVSVDWPGGQRETWESLRTNRTWRLIEGTASEPATSEPAN